MKKVSNKKIISKYIDSEATEAEVDQLLKWLEKKKNQSTFKDYLKAKLLIDIKFKSFDSKEALVSFLDEIKEINKDNNKSRFRSWLKYAAIFIGILILSTYALYESSPKFSKINISEVTLEINENDVEMILLEERKVITNKKGKEIGFIKNGILSYKDNFENKKKSASKNKLTVPYGKQFDVILADGTFIHLNSGSVLEYPSNFEGSSKREVSLEGEAYFIVAKNESLPFIVKTNKLDTRVYGTEFNVSAYPEDNFIEVVLVEGSVGIQEVEENENSKMTEQYVMLQPSQKASTAKKLKGVKVENVNIISYISWKDGILMFNDEKIESIFKKLERQFNIEIENNYPELYKHSYTGVFKSENLEEILITISAHTHFSYTRTGQKISINKQ